MGRRIRRYVFFILAIAIGVAFGVLLGWAVNPLNTVNTGLDSLRIDYKTDYVLMVAQLYQSEGNIATALAHLALLGQDAPADIVQRAINFASQRAYAPAYITTMENLAGAIAQHSPTSE